MKYQTNYLRKIVIAIILLASVLLISGCTNNEEAPDIYASIYPIEFITKEIVGNRLVVKSIYPRGKDVHDYEPTPKDVLKMANSKLIFYIGLGLEPIIENSKSSVLKNVPIVALSDNLELVELNGDHVHNHGDDHDDIFYDPHIWLDPEKMQKMTQNVLKNIISYFKPSLEDTEYFTNNATNLIDKLNKLDEDFFKVINDSSILNKTIIVDHDAYAYWEIRYGIKRIRLRNDNESTDIIPKEMQEKISLAKELKIKYICTTKNEMESSIINQYLRELNLTSDAKMQLHHLATITAEEEKAGNDYFSLMRDNLEVLKKVFPRQ